MINAACNDIAIGGLLSVLNNILSIIQVIGPILAIVSITFHFISLVRNPDDKKAMPKIKNSIIALVLLYFIPLIVNIVFGLLGNSNDISACWNNITPIFNTGVYQEIDEGHKKVWIFTLPSDYQKGKEKKEDSMKETNNKTDESTSAKKEVVEEDTTVSPKAQHIVFIGDSRTVQMYAHSTGDWSGANYSSGGVHELDNDIYVAEGSMGLGWLESTGVPAAEAYFNSDSAIVILMGVNDLDSAYSYINYINSNASNWKARGSSLYFVSVNPCSGNYAHLNDKIVQFNNTLKENLSNEVEWIDTHSYLMENGFNTTDGLHYDSETSKAIYNYIKSRV